MFLVKRAKQKIPSYMLWHGLDAERNCFIWRPGLQLMKALSENVLACDYRQPAE
jgi:hypothetical protein